jgi:hypothetical protein
LHQRLSMFTVRTFFLDPISEILLIHPSAGIVRYPDHLPFIANSANATISFRQSTSRNLTMHTKDAVQASSLLKDGLIVRL